jgi:tRNA(adenine34) deaminase
MRHDHTVIAERSDEYYMQQALKEAHIAFDKGEVPVGAVVVAGGQIIGRGHNQVELLKDPTAHAEMIALTAAFHYIGAKYLPDATLYVTVEPCLMCAGALYWSKIGAIVWGADDEKNGHRRISKQSPFHTKAQNRIGILQEPCARLMKEFFQNKR